MPPGSFCCLLKSRAGHAILLSASKTDRDLSIEIVYRGMWVQIPREAVTVKRGVYA